MSSELAAAPFQPARKITHPPGCRGDCYTKRRQSKFWPLLLGWLLGWLAAWLIARASCGTCLHDLINGQLKGSQAGILFANFVPGLPHRPFCFTDVFFHPSPFLSHLPQLNDGQSYNLCFYLEYKHTHTFPSSHHVLYTQGQ